MQDRPTSNPASRFAKSTVTYDEGDGPPASSITLLEDHSRSILSHNDSPDLGFRWSANPYRGCCHACAFCMDGDTPVLFGDARTRPLRDIKVGQEIYGTRVVGKKRFLTKTRVKATWSSIRDTYRIELADGTKLIASGDHRFLTNRGWKHVVNFPSGPDRAHLTANNWLIGVGACGFRKF